MNVQTTPIPGVLILEPKVFGDDRGFFFESFNRRTFQLDTGLDVEFVQDNHSLSAKGVLRGLHYQIEHPQGKLVRVTQGEVWDVVVDLRRHSPTFGKSFGMTLSASKKQQLWIPVGLAHGFLVLSETAEFLYKTTDYWFPQAERCIAWDDPTLAIDWPLAGQPLVSDKDRQGLQFAAAPCFD